MHIECYETIDTVPIAIWEEFASRKTISMEADHLRAVEESGINNIRPHYFIGFLNAEPVGIAYGFSIHVNFAKLANICPTEVFDAIKAWKPDFMEVNIIEIGHIASLGSTIEVNPQYLSEFLPALVEKIENIAQREQTDLCIFRDVSIEQYTRFTVLHENGYEAVMGFPVARMPLRWKSMEDYIGSLKAKKRRNFLLKRAKLNLPDITVEVIEDYAPYAGRLAELWTNVAKVNNGYSHEQLTAEYFRSMARNLKGRSHVVAIKQSGNIVAYGLNLIGDSEYFGVAEGMDYSIRNKYDLYANNIFEALRVAISLKKKVFNIGITTYDFKTSIGAELEPTIYFLKSFKNPGYTTVFADFIKGAIPQPENKHRAFRTTDITKRMQLNEIKLTVGYGEVTLDPFAKHYSYVRSDAARLADLYTFSPVFESAQEPVIQQSGRNVIMLGTNAYLGLATHPDVIAAATKAVESYGSGCSGSPMLNGTINLHKELAAKLAQFMMKQDALIFSTGYQTNVGVLSALVNRNDVIVMDERSHASLIDGALLSRARIVRYKHNCMVSLEAALEKYADKPKLIVTDTLFSMEGTIIDLPDIIRLAKKFHARLMLDESHAIGIMGQGGKGIAEHFGLLDEVDVIMGTFSKSLASIGGFVAGDRKLIDTLRHISRAHIFSASLPPAAVATVLAALEIIENDSERRAQVLKNATFLASELQNLGFNISYHGGAILTVHCGHELIAFAAYKKLLGEGVFVNPVTSPAIPKGQEVLRISVMATHTESMLQKALSIFEKIKTPYWPINI